MSDRKTASPDQRAFLIKKMREITDFNGEFRHELYTLMYAVAMREGILYSLETHNEIIDEFYQIQKP
jgi:hypothetical protein